MNAELEQYLKLAVPSDEHVALRGKRLSEAAFNTLEEELKLLFPPWLRDMFLNYPIANLILRFQSKTGEINAIQFYDFDEISDSYFRLSPGNFVAPLGYIAIADDPRENGNTYFIRLDQGENPPVYQIAHGPATDPAEILRSKTTLVADSLSTLFENQTTS
ncbi:MAG: SMI1/KNR4 family protein [Saprospiraceae bacterium]|nr:SMI1/KNR4 family protein [Saprospiraceae bacterium]